MHQILFILGYIIKPQRRHILQRRAKTNNASGIGCAGFKPPRCFSPGCAFTQADGGDHRTAPFPRRHFLQQGFFDIKNANPGGWFNPYRVSVNIKPGTIRELNNTLNQQPASVYVQHRDWIKTSGDRLVLDPGIPEVQQWITNIVAEVVSRYPVDGVQFDDYFYTESAGSKLNDNDTFRRYGAGFASKADWRRHNTQQLITQVSRTIKKLNPNVEFGVSPAGVWRNRSHDPMGSDTRGAAAYDESYADTRRWVQLGLLDYIAPQIYWPFSRSAARYDVLAKWWADVVKPTNTRLYIGVAFYKVGEPSKVEPDWMVNGGVPELKKQLDLNDTVPEISGTILFREDYLNKPQTQQAVNYLRSRWGS